MQLNYFALCCVSDKQAAKTYYIMIVICLLLYVRPVGQRYAACKEYEWMKLSYFTLCCVSDLQVGKTYYMMLSLLVWGMPLAKIEYFLTKQLASYNGQSHIHHITIIHIVWLHANGTIESIAWQSS